MSAISVLQQQSFLLRLELALITPVDSPRIRMVDGVDVPLHVVHIITLVIAHGAGKETLSLLAVHFAVVDLQIMFIGTFEGAVCTGVLVLVHFVECVIMLGIVIN